MKNNAILRIIIWGLVIVLLVGVLCAVIFGTQVMRSESSLEATEYTLNEAPTMLVEIEYLNIEAIVTADAVNVRTTPSSSSLTIDYVEKDTVVIIGRAETVSNENWVWISSPTNGWLKAEYIQCNEDLPFGDSTAAAPSAQENSSDTGISATVTDNLNIRSSPSEDSVATGMLEPGDTVTIGRSENINGEQWAFITAPSSGWILMKYVQEDAVSSGFDETTVTMDVLTSGESIGVNADQVRDIDIDWASGSITIVSADVTTIEVSETGVTDEKYAMRWNVSGSKLRIQFSEENLLNFSFGINQNIEKDLTIYVPMDWECDSLEVDAASAALNVSNLVIGEVEIDTASGECSFTNCVVDSMEVDTASGNVNFAGTLKSLECDAASATVDAILDNVPSRVTMDSMSGNLRLVLPDSAGFTLKMDSLSGDCITSGFNPVEDKNGNYVYGDGACYINFNSMSGMVVIEKAQAAAAIAETTAAP